MALTVSPFATGFPSDSLDTGTSSIQSYSNMSRAVSINMDGMGTDPSAETEQYVESLDIFGDTMGMTFGADPRAGGSMIGELCASLTFSDTNI
jgi:hypothetical protein